jgi:hypothetical protein
MRAALSPLLPGPLVLPGAGTGCVCVGSCGLGLDAVGDALAAAAPGLGWAEGAVVSGAGAAVDAAAAEDVAEDEAEAEAEAEAEGRMVIGRDGVDETVTGGVDACSAFTTPVPVPLPAVDAAVAPVE